MVFDKISGMTESLKVEFHTVTALYESFQCFDEHMIVCLSRIQSSSDNPVQPEATSGLRRITFHDDENATKTLLSKFDVSRKEKRQTTLSLTLKFKKKKSSSVFCSRSEFW